MIEKKPIHTNNGRCQKCLSIINRYPGFYAPLKEWFIEMQAEFPELHTSCAGRNDFDQQWALDNHKSDAPPGKSAHNWGCALDLFRLLPDGSASWKEAWYDQILTKHIPLWMTWYGIPGSPFFEKGHVQLKNWSVAALKGDLKRVA